MTEQEIQAEVLTALAAFPHVLRVWRNNTGFAVGNGRVVRFGVPGQADISGLLAPNGRRIEIEVKRPGGKPSDQQRLFGAMVSQMGGCWAVVTSADEAIALVRRIVRDEPWGARP